MGQEGLEPSRQAGQPLTYHPRHAAVASNNETGPYVAITPDRRHPVLSIQGECNKAQFIDGWPQGNNRHIFDSREGNGVLLTGTFR